MELTDQMREAIDLIENTNQCLFITGKAGSGKTTFLQYVIENTKKNCIVAAPTGVAAIKCGGATLHKLFNIPFGVLPPNEAMKGNFQRSKVDLFKYLELLVIDEISMVRADVLDYIDRKLKLYRMNLAPFGGVQVVMFGDLYQLPPVIKTEEQEVLSEFYESGYFFDAKVWRNCGFRMIEFSKVFRQSDPNFIRLLNNIREYKTTWADLQDLDELRDKRKAAKFDNDYIHLCVFKNDAMHINKKMLGEPTHRFEAKYTGKFSPKNAPCDEVLELKVGAKVMMIVNDPDEQFYNGSVGIIRKIEKEIIDIELNNGNMASVGKYTWKDRDYEISKNGSTTKITPKSKGTCTQFPLILGWAITIHKSQGLTFDKVVIHASRTFAPGQLYVALSRCTSMEGIITDCFISFGHIIPDKTIHSFFLAMEKYNNVFDSRTYQSMVNKTTFKIDV